VVRALHDGDFQGVIVDKRYDRTYRFVASKNPICVDGVIYPGYKVLKAGKHKN